MLWIGRISCSFYLLHGVAIHLIRQELDKHPGLKGYHGGLYSLLALALSLMLAQISFDLFERPGIRLGRSLTRIALTWIAAFRTRRGDLKRRPTRTDWLFSRVRQADKAEGRVAHPAGGGPAFEIQRQP